MDTIKQLIAVRAENELLKEQIALLRRALISDDDLRPAKVFHLTPIELRVFGVLMQKDIASVKVIMTAMYWDMESDWPEEKSVDIRVCALRKKLELHGIEISTLHGHGRFFSPEMKARIRAALDAYEVRAA